MIIFTECTRGYFSLLLAAAIMAHISDVCACGGAEGPYEQILEFVGGRCPGGAPGTEGDRIWQRMLSWRFLCLSWHLVWKQYQRLI